MTMTTIKVLSATRDRLKAQARAVNRPLGEYLGELADLADRQSRFESLRQAIATSPDPIPSGYADELAVWERTELSDVPSDA